MVQTEECLNRKTPDRVSKSLLVESGHRDVRPSKQIVRRPHVKARQDRRYDSDHTFPAFVHRSRLADSPFVRYWPSGALPGLLRAAQRRLPGQVVGIFAVTVLACGLLAWPYFYASDLPPVSRLYLLII